VLKGKGLSEDKIALVEKRRGEEWKRLKKKGKSKRLLELIKAIDQKRK